MRPSRDIVAMVAAAGAGIQVGAAVVASRFVVQETGPVVLAWLRYGIALLCVLPLLAFMGFRLLPRRDVLPVMALGVLQFGVLILLLNIGLQWVAAAQAAIIFSSFPLLTLVLAAALGRESITVLKCLGVLLAMGGAMLATDGSILGEGGMHGIAGAAVVFGAAICGAVCAVLYRPYLERHPTVPVVAYSLLAAVLFLSILAIPHVLASGSSTLSAKGWAAVWFIGLSSGVAFILWLWALKRVSPTKVAVFLSLSPITAALLGVPLLGEPLTAHTMAGLVCAVAGLAIANWHEKPRRADS